ncbi:MAG: helix-turn-helix transcriptional regulator [Chloroflexi bacterium]|nr:helix-turn-helix transcriptional regulator [Chloroflexota bacterium]
MQPAPLERALARVGDRWTLLIVDALLGGPRRYGELADEVTGIAPNTLADRLKKLESVGLVVSSPYQQRPVRVAYELTAEGRELGAALAVLAGWAARAEGLPGSTYHDACGTTLDVVAWCPTCERVVSPGEADDLDRL